MIYHIAKYTERVVLMVLVVMLALVLLFSTIELGITLVRHVGDHGEGWLIDLNLLPDLFGAFLLILIGIELLETVKIYLRESIVHVEVVILVAIIAIARKVVVMKIDEYSGAMLLGIGGLILSLSVAYFLIKKAGYLRFDLTPDAANETDSSNNSQHP